MAPIQPENKTTNERRHATIPPLLCKRIVPAESRKSAEVSVCRVGVRVVLKSNGGEVRIGGEIACSSHVKQQTAQQVKMARPGLQDHSPRPREPKSIQFQGLFYSQRFRKNSLAGRHAQEADQDAPGKPYRLCSRKNFIQPSLSTAVKRIVFIDCVYKQIDVRRNHRPSANLIFRIVSASSSSSPSAKAFVKSTSGVPMEYVFCTKRGPLSWSMAPVASPARTASLRTRSNSTFRLRTSWRSSASTSGSRFTTACIDSAYQATELMPERNRQTPLFVALPLFQ